MSEKIAGVSAAVAFMLVLMIGVFFEQPTDEVLMKSLVALVMFYILGFIFGEAGSMVVLENMERFDLNRWLETEGKTLGIHMEGGELIVEDADTIDADAAAAAVETVEAK